MNKLYPPSINGTLPAFYTDEDSAEIIIPYQNNRSVGLEDITGFALKLKKI
jgi:hypothetical protein